MNEKKVIPIFLATDDNYAKILAVALRSIIDNANKKDYFYKVYILETNLDTKYLDVFNDIVGEYGIVEYVNINEQIDYLKSRLTLRDYYTYTTYYRIFISEMFKCYDKALYLDCDIVVNGDISRLYNSYIGDNLVGAIQEEVMFINDDFFKYAPLNLGVSTFRYFNAGVLVMNLKRFRSEKIYNKFVKLISERQYKVAQDQDYLNVICKGRVRYLPYSWNKTPISVGILCQRVPNLVHYKLTLKPWKYDNIKYGGFFWKYASRTPFYEELLNNRNNYSAEQKKLDAFHSKHLHQIIIEENNKALSVLGEDDGRIIQDAIRI